MQQLHFINRSFRVVRRTFYDFQSDVMLRSEKRNNTKNPHASAQNEVKQQISLVLTMAVADWKGMIETIKRLISRF